MAAAVIAGAPPWRPASSDTVDDDLAALWRDLAREGPLSRAINVAVDGGRAKVVDEFEGEPTVTIALDGLLFTRLAGGRVAVAHDAITYSGDEAVGRRIVEHLNYVI